MKSKVLLASLATVLVMSSLMLGCAVEPTPAPTPAPTPTPTPTPAPAPAPPTEEKIVWRLQTFTNAPDYPTPWLQFFADGVKERTDGRLEVQIFFAGELGYAGAEYLRALRDGLLDCALVCTPYHVGDFPLFGLSNQPFLLGSPAEFAIVSDQITPIMFERLAKEWSVEPLIQVPVFPQTFQSTKPINSMDDLKGLKIRTSGVAQAELWKAAGASPVSITMAEVYTSLQRGVIDATNIALSLHLTMGHYEVAEYVYTLDVNSPAMVIAASKEFYDVLPADIQQAVHDAADATFPIIVADGAKGVEADIAKLREKGNTVQALSPDLEAELRALAPPIWEAWAESLSPEIPEAKQLLDIIRATLHR